MKRILARGLFLLALLTAGVSVSFVARGAASFEKTVQLIAGRADTVELQGAVADVLVANPLIADVGTLRSDRLYIVGKNVGDTNVLAYDEAGNQLANISVHVRLDDKNMQETLREFFPNENITARTVKDNIVLSGKVSTPAIASQVRDLATRFLVDKSLTLVDLMKVRGEQQVMLKVKVVEASRTLLKELGVQTSLRSGATDGFTISGNDVGRTSNLTPFGVGTLILGRDAGALTTALRALENNKLANTLAEPTLTAISGETAGFLAGGEFPVPTSRDTQGNVILEFKQFGVSLNFTPTVMDRERIALHLSTEVSEQDRSQGVTLEDITIPGLAVRRAETTVEMGSGATLMIAGLIKSNTLHAFSGLPGVQDLPIIGQLFKSRSFTRDESELLIVVTPYLVDPYAEPAGVAETAPPAMLPGHPTPPSEKTGAEKTESILGKSATVQERTVAAKGVAMVPDSPRKAAAARPLSAIFANNLRKAYGNRTPESVGTGAGFGYIVE